MKNIYDRLTKSYANNIINQIPDNKQETVVLDTVATVHYPKSDATHRSSTNMGPPIHGGCQNGKTMQSRKLCLLDFPALPDEVR